MKPVSPELLALLSSRQFFVADLYTFILANNTVLTYCGGDRDIVANGVTFSAGGAVGPYLDRTDNKALVHQKIGVDVDTLNLDILPGAAVVEGTPFLAAVHDGAFDGAVVILDRAFMPTYGDTSRGLVRKFVGRVAEVDVSRGVATFAINSHLELLNIQLPRNLYQSTCSNCLGDAGCGVNLSNSAYNTTGTVVSASTNSNSIFQVSLARTPPNGAFDLGTIAFSGGILAGNTYSVRTCAFGTPNSTVTLLGTAPHAPNPGDPFTIYYGCDRTTGEPFYLNATANRNSGEQANTLTYVSNVAGVQIGYSVIGINIPEGTTVLAITRDPDVTWSFDVVMSQKASNASSTGLSVTFSAPASPNGCAKFGNNARFTGAPYIPQPAMAT